MTARWLPGLAPGTRPGGCAAGHGRAVPWDNASAARSACLRRRPQRAAPATLTVRCRPQRTAPGRCGWLPGLAPKAPHAERPRRARPPGGA
jgi:hypothetical protein